ncbi:MAG: hypothetical protein WCA79_03970, partial [Anaerolineales bacterium]
DYSPRLPVLAQASTGSEDEDFTAIFGNEALRDHICPCQYLPLYKINNLAYNEHHNKVRHYTCLSALGSLTA